MSKQEKSIYDKSLQKIEYEMDWKAERTAIARERFTEKVQKQKMKRTLRNLFMYSSSLVVAATLLLYFYHTELNTPDIFQRESVKATGTENGTKLYERKVVNKTYNTERLILTEKGKQQLVYPIEAYKKINTILGEGSVGANFDRISGKEVLHSSVFYQSSISKDIHIHNSYHNSTAEERIKVFLPHPKFPSNSYSTEVVTINGHQAVIRQSNQDYGVTSMNIVTDTYEYYLSTSQTMEGLSEIEKKEIREELIQLASLFMFEKENAEW
ncbi:hypothetical protein [Sutcliffiella halmapala]|uniref:hypothetical protein n=1 Tax=Sutcliffiella halmapala TaxID=79882 RepID=UPI000995B569|nr:hypothetical protein [Sutcliffiella halmapala]